MLIIYTAKPHTMHAVLRLGAPAVFADEPLHQAVLP